MKILSYYNNYLVMAHFVLENESKGFLFSENWLFLYEICNQVKLSQRSPKQFN